MMMMMKTDDGGGGKGGGEDVIGDGERKEKRGEESGRGREKNRNK